MDLRIFNGGKAQNAGRKAPENEGDYKDSIGFSVKRKFIDTPEKRAEFKKTIYAFIEKQFGN